MKEGWQLHLIYQWFHMWVLPFSVISSLRKFDNKVNNFFFLYQYCTHRDTSNKKDFPSFARTRPPDTQISKSVASLLLAFNWTQITFIYLNLESEMFIPVAETVLQTLKLAGVNVRSVQTWNQIYHHGYSTNPFDAIVDKTFMDTRSKFFLNEFRNKNKKS